MGSYIIGIGAGVLLFNVVYINMLMCVAQPRPEPGMWRKPRPR